MILKMVHIITIEDFLTSRTNICFAVPQASILEPLLFLLYINDLNKAPEVLESTKCVETNLTSLFYSHQTIKTLFGKVNCVFKK